ncbi:MAG TPA: permease prefix domain 2-containing transporter, partial [Acidobacteriaceae bacterium]
LPDDEQPSLLSQAVSQPPTYVSVHHVIPQMAQATFFQATVREASRNIQDGINVYGSFLDAVSTTSASPPAMSEFLFSLLGPEGSIDSMLGDLEERFHADLESVSPSRARWRYRSRVWRSLGPLVLRKLKNWGFLAVILELGRRKIGW